MSGCFDSDAEKACEYTNGTLNGAIYLTQKCYNASVVALNESLAELGGDTVYNKNLTLPESDKISAAQEFFK